MDDKTLLELAAKAAGIEDLKFNHDLSSYYGDDTNWNPLTDDGDALRLAVKLGFRIECTKSGYAYVWKDVTLVWNEIALHEWVEDERIAATRRAIVRAAAEIGKNMLTGS